MQISWVIPSGLTTDFSWTLPCGYGQMVDQRASPRWSHSHLQWLADCQPERPCFLQVATLSSSKITWAQSQYSLWNSKHRIPSAQALFKSLLVSRLLTSIGQGKSHGQPNSVMRKQIPLLNGRIFNIILPGVRCRKRKNFWPSFNLPLLSYPKHTRHIHTCAQAGPITWNKLSPLSVLLANFYFLTFKALIKYSI